LLIAAKGSFLYHCSVAAPDSIEAIFNGLPDVEAKGKLPQPSVIKGYTGEFISRPPHVLPSGLDWKRSFRILEAAWTALDCFSPISHRRETNHQGDVPESARIRGSSNVRDKQYLITARLDGRPTVNTTERN
jgi:hypothetical protein